MTIRKPLYLVLFTLLAAGGLSAQVSAGMDYYRPAGRLGQVFKQGMGISVEYSPHNTIRRRTATYFGRLYRITAQQDTLYHNDGISGAGGNRTSGSSFEVYSPTFYGELGVQWYYRLYVDKPFSPFATVSGQGFVSHGERYSFSPGISEHFNGGDRGAGMSLGLGAEYELNRNYSVRLLFAHTFQFGSEYGYTRYWRSALSGVYYW